MTTFRLTNPIEFPTPKIQNTPFFGRKLSKQEWIFIAACIILVILVTLIIVRSIRKSSKPKKDTPPKKKPNYSNRQAPQSGGYNSPFIGFSQ